MFMQQIIINNTSGYLCKDIKINKDDFIYLYNKKMIIELNSLQEKKYKSKYFISEVGYLFLKLGDYEERYNIVNKYINLRSNMSFMNKEYLEDLDSIYPGCDKRFKYKICFYKGQIYSLDSIFKKSKEKNYYIILKDKDYIIKDGEKIVAKIIYKSSGVYSLKDISKYGFLKKNLQLQIRLQLCYIKIGKDIVYMESYIKMLTNY